MTVVHIKRGYFYLTVAAEKRGWGRTWNEKLHFSYLRLLASVRVSAAHALNTLAFHDDYSHKTHSICEESSGYTSNDIEIFITAYEITASIIKQTKSKQSTPPMLGKQTDKKKKMLALKKRGANEEYQQEWWYKLDCSEAQRVSYTKMLQKVEKTVEPLSGLSYQSESIIYCLDVTFPQQLLINWNP